MTSALRPPRAAAAKSLAGGGPSIDFEDWLAISDDAWLVFDNTGRILRRSGVLHSGALRSAHLDDWPPEWRAAIGWPEQLPPPFQTHERQAWLKPPGERTARPTRLRVRGLRALPKPLWLAGVHDCTTVMQQQLAERELAATVQALGVHVASQDAQRGWISMRAPSAVPSTPSDANASATDASTRTATSLSISRESVEPASLESFETLQRALRERRAADVSYGVRDAALGPRRLRTWVHRAVHDSDVTPPPWLAPDLLTLITRDVTSEQTAHGRARIESESLRTQMQLIFDAAPLAVALLQDAVVARRNALWDEYLGPHAAQQAPLADRLQQAGVAPAAAAQALRQLANDGRAQLMLQAAGTASGASRALQMTLQRAGAATSVLAIVRDLTQQQHEQAQLEWLARDRELLFNLADVGIVYLRDGRIERVNAAFADLIGRPLDGLIGLPLAELFEDESAFLAYRSRERQQLQAHGRFKGECRLRHVGGARIWVQASTRQVDAHDDAQGTITSFVSVDERRRARETLQLQVERTRAILDSVLVGIVTVGEQGIDWMNRSARRMFAGELADFAGQPLATVATDEPDHPLRLQDWINGLQVGRTDTFECQLQARDGRRFWVAGNVVATGSAQQPQLTLALLDIQRRREAEHHIAQARASLQRIIETAPMAIALFDARTQTVLQLNEAMTRLARRPFNEIEGRPPALWLPGPQAAALSADLHQAQTSHETVREWVRETDPADGASLSVWDMRIVKLDDSSAMGTQLLLVASDVTEQRAAGEARLQAAIVQREMLVREVHHRIKNNLQGVAGLLQQSALRHPDSAAAINEAVGQVHAIAQVHGLQVGVIGPLRVRNVVEAIAQSVQRMFGRQITVSVSGQQAHRFALTEADSIPIALTVNELLTNAIKHAVKDDSAIGCDLHFGAGDLQLVIRNNGALASGFSLAAIPGGISGLGLVRSLLPRKGATMDLRQCDAQVHASLLLAPPAIALLEPL